MSGGQVAYHLRPNKAIDRQIFLDVLTRFHGYRPIHGYTYVGFGGPFLEDFRAIDGRFGLERMISLESDSEVIARQKFNRPLTSIDCHHESSGDFIAKFETEVPGSAIVWLDYAEANARRVQLGEFQSLLTKLRAFDLVKVTINANPASLAIPQNVGPAEVAAARFTAAEKQVGDLWQPGVTADDMTRKRFPAVILGCVLRVAQQALPVGGDLRFLPLTAFVYADSEHSMLTVTGAVLPDREHRAARAALRLSSWSLGYRGGRGPLRIMAPMLSTRERVHLESKLPRYRRSLARRASFSVGSSGKESAELLESFALYHRYYPQFARIIP